MQLSRRLKMVADFVTPGYRVADIGCDHAYTSIYLVKEKIASYVIAMDVNKGPLKKAQANIMAYRLTDQIETRLSDGAEKLVPGEVDTILLSGMGGLLMIRILTDRMEVFKNLKEVVLQPQSEIHLVRRFLHEQGYQIVHEAMVKEDGKYYTAIHAIHGEECYENEIFYQFGKSLLENKDPVLKEFLEREKRMKEEIRSNLLRKQTQNSKKRMDELDQELEHIDQAYNYYNT